MDYCNELKTLRKKTLGDKDCPSDLKEIVDRSFYVPELNKDVEVLFLGLNPSFDGTETEQLLYDGKENIEKKVNSFYRSIKTFTELVEGEHNYGILDLLPIRETNSKKALSLMQSEAGLKFICACLEISLRAIMEIRPSIIVCLHSAIGNFLGLNKTEKLNVWMGLNFDEHESESKKVGTPIFSKARPSLNGHPNEIDFGKNIPVFFNGFITYMESNTKKRLAWHLNYALNHELIKQSK